MSFCEHCAGQRFDRARVLRALRQVRREARRSECDADVDEAIHRAIEAVRVLDLPHLATDEEEWGTIVH